MCPLSINKTLRNKDSINYAYVITMPEAKNEKD